jgi:proteasome assembly chaperone (PAC2) family protein
VNEHDLVDPWLVAAWPGMGGVAQIAGQYLVRTLGARPIAELEPREHFDVQSVHVKGGLVQPGELPHSRLFAWKNPSSGHDLLIFLGDKQPPVGGYRFCHELLEVALRLGIERVFTFAAMGTPIHPKGEPRVFAVASREDVLAEVRALPIELLVEGEITGLNGVFLAAAAERELGGACFLGEFPYFASPVPNPKASAAVLRVFARLAVIELDLGELDAQARLVERNLVAHLQRLQRAIEAQSGTVEPPAGEEWKTPSEKEDELSTADSQRIEALFERARHDRSKALELKTELDRLGAFKRYEDRFLDLFKRGE